MCLSLLELGGQVELVVVEVGGFVTELFEVVLAAFSPVLVLFDCFL